MMQKLQDKAKTKREIWNEPDMSRQKPETSVDTLWVRLEDAQQLNQEANKLSMERLEYKVKLEECQKEFARQLEFLVNKQCGEWKQKLQSKEFLEALAELEHEQWMEWSKAIAPEINTAYYLPHLIRWKKCWVSYSKLTEEQKEHDRVWARKIVEELLK